MTAYVIGNGESRKPIPLHRLGANTYGCNALYRDFVPDCLVATDPPISRAIQDSGYSKHRRFHTRHVFGGSGARPLQSQYAGWSSGPNALQLAVHDGHKDIYMLGFDFGSTHSKFNNVYADTEFYRQSHETATFGGNWVNQVETVFKRSPRVQFTIVIGNESNKITKFSSYPNVKFMEIQEFLKVINNV